VKLPNADLALIESAKLRNYLLSPNHPIGRFKCSFFTSLGYSSDEWERLKVDLLDHASTGKARFGQATEYGQKYEVHGILTGPAGKAVELVSVWIILEGDDLPRFITAFPGGK